MARRLVTVLIATAVAGTLQLGIAFLLAAASGRGLLPVLREMAAGLFGEDMRFAEASGATIGLAGHFAAVAVMVLLYLLAARPLTRLRAHPLAGGMGYGLLIGGLHWLFATRGLPTLFPQVTPVNTSVALAAFIVCIGLPIGWIVARRGR